MASKRRYTYAAPLILLVLVAARTKWGGPAVSETGEMLMSQEGHIASGDLAIFGFSVPEDTLLRMELTVEGETSLDVLTSAGNMTKETFQLAERIHSIDRAKAVLSAFDDQTTMEQPPDPFENRLSQKGVSERLSSQWAFFRAGDYSTVIDNSDLYSPAQGDASIRLKIYEYPKENAERLRKAIRKAVDKTVRERVRSMAEESVRQAADLKTEAVDSETDPCSAPQIPEALMETQIRRLLPGVWKRVDLDYVEHFMTDGSLRLKGRGVINRKLDGNPVEGTYTVDYSCTALGTWSVSEDILSCTIDKVEEFHLNKPFQLDAPEYKESHGPAEFEAFRANYERLWIEEGPGAMEGTTIARRIIELTNTTLRHADEEGRIGLYRRLE